jgi:hypothetical protein
VTVKAAPGADVEMTADFNNSANITLDGVDKLDNATIEGTSHDITVSGSNVTAPGGAIVVHPDQMGASSDIVIDHNTLKGQLCDASSALGRIAIENVGANDGHAVGITISNNLLQGGDADGIRPDAGSGIQILNNQFIGFDNTLNEVCHTDAIQEYGSAHDVTVKGNFFYNSVDMAGCSLSAWDGLDHFTFENNVVAGSPNQGCYGAIELYSDNGSKIIHNTFAYGGCEPHYDASTPCGVIYVDRRSADPAGTGTVIRDNIATDISFADGSTGTEHHNLFRVANPGTGDVTGSPQFVGGAAPTTFAGFALAPGSKGIGAASDGTNMGIELPTGG